MAHFASVLVFAFALVFIQIETTVSLKCYYCISSKPQGVRVEYPVNPNCARNPGKEYLKAVPQQSQYDEKSVFCVTQLHSPSYGNQIVVRFSRSIIRDHRKILGIEGGNNCIQSERGDVKETMCYCNTNGCNDAGAYSPSMILLSAGILAVIIMDPCRNLPLQ